MDRRIDYRRIAPEAAQAILRLEQYARRPGLEPGLLELVKLRASYQNGCAHCVDMHTKDARARGEGEQRLVRRARVARDALPHDPRARTRTCMPPARRRRRWTRCGPRGRAYDRVYPLAGSLDQLLRPPYDAVGAQLASASIAEGQAKQRLAPVPRDNVQPAVVTALLADAESAISRALAENDVYDWKPRAAVRLYFASADQTVPPRNTLTAAARMQELGATVDAIDLGPLGHTDAVIPAFLAARSWFDTFVK